MKSTKQVLIINRELFDLYFKEYIKCWKLTALASADSRCYGRYLYHLFKLVLAWLVLHTAHFDLAVNNIY
jgi:hypothetical protein